MTYDPAEREIDEQTVRSARRGDGESSVRMLRPCDSRLRGEVAMVVLGLPDWLRPDVTAGKDGPVSVSDAGDLTQDGLARIAGSLRPTAD